MREYIIHAPEGLGAYEEEYISSFGKPIERLIRCKDCIYYDGHYCHNKWWGDGYGNYTSPIKAEDGYCDWAERREDD